MNNTEKKRAERLNQAYKYLYNKGIVSSITALATKMGRTRISVSNALRGVEGFVNETFLSKFCGEFPEFSSDWLLYGEGEMLAPQPMAASVSVSPELLERLYSELHSLRQEVANMRQEIANMRVNTYNYAPSLSMVADSDN